MFIVRNAADLVADRDAVLVVPSEGNSKQGNNFHRVPIRAAPPSDVCSGSGNGNVVDVEGGLRVAPTPAGLRRLLLRFPESFCNGVKEFDTADGERQNLSLGFALFDHRVGPTAEEARVLENIDALSGRIRRTLYGCERIRTTLGFGSSKMSAVTQRTLADEMDLWISKPVTEEEDTATSITTPGHNHSSSSGSGFNSYKRAYGGAGAVVAVTQPPPPRSRYCYVKLVPPTPTVNEMFLTYLWTPNGRPLGLDAVRRLQKFRVVPFVELEDVFVNKAMRSLQMKLRECIIFPPPERPTHRLSAAFPNRVCTRDAAEGICNDDDDQPHRSVVTTPGDDVVVAPPPPTLLVVPPITACEEEEEDNDDIALPTKRRRTVATTAVRKEEGRKDLSASVPEVTRTTEPVNVEVVEEVVTKDDDNKNDNEEIKNEDMEVEEKVKEGEHKQEREDEKDGDDGDDDENAEPE
jgi:hypothetical protein